MFSSFSYCAPYIVALTILVSGVIAFRWQKRDLQHLDGFAALLGFGLGLLITSLNLIYSNHYLITLGPILTIICALYLRYRERLLATETESFLTFEPRTLRVISILYWTCLTGAVLTYYLAPVYTRPTLFFVCIALCVALLGLETLAKRPMSNFLAFTIIGKTLLASLILRASAYFISPYPVGADPWAHAEYIKNFLYFDRLEVMSYPPGAGVSEYYIQYPIMHLYATVTDLICNLCVKDSMFVVGGVLALSTIFVYLTVKYLLNNANIALFAMLLVNFADFHIQWSIEVIGMTFGIALYTILLYATIRHWQSPKRFYLALLLLCIFLIVWTHTVTTFIALTSLFALAMANVVYPLIYSKAKDKRNMIGMTIIAFFMILLTLKWMDPSYPFLEAIIKGLQNSLSAEAEFLGRTGVKFVAERQIGRIFDIIGFLVYVTLGILGCLCCLSERYADKARVSLVVMISALFFVFFAFPLMGMRNIVPYRWPAFIYITLVFFIGIGLVKAGRMFRNRRSRGAAIFSLLLLTSFFMATNFAANMDSPLYNSDKTWRGFLSESELLLSLDVSKHSDSFIISDGGVIFGPLKYYVRSDKCGVIYYWPSGDINWGYFDDKLFIWRQCTINRVVPMGSTNAPPFPLGLTFQRELDKRYSCTYDIGSAKAYM